MEKADNEMYALVDEEFLAKFSNQHLNYMKKLYYSFYAGYCKRIKRKPLTSEDFFKNMHLRRFQLYQLCCPYCGTVSLCIHDKKESKTAGYNFCHSCGRTSTLKNIQKHLARFVRIKRMNRISIQAVAEGSQYPVNHPKFQRSNSFVFQFQMPFCRYHLFFQYS